MLVGILSIYAVLFSPWLLLVWYGYKTVWWYALGALAIALPLRVVWTKIEMVTGAVKNAWAISLIGIPTMPVLVIIMIELTLRSTDTASLLETCRRCPL